MKRRRHATRGRGGNRGQQQGSCEDRGDLRVLRGSGGATIQRVYWSNKGSAIVADVPSEAELSPHLWGRLEFVNESE